MQLNEARRIIVKVGSSLIADEVTGAARTQWLASLAEDVAALKAQGKQVIVVTSGAVALGRGLLNVTEKQLRLEQKQAAAACGQVPLMKAWQESFAPVNITVAQLLLTIDESENRRRWLNAQNTLETLLEQGIVPVINENDTVATLELRFGDNDTLAARVAQMASADVLVLLSDIDGLYTANPADNADAQFIPEVKQITPEIEKMAGSSSSSFGTGGMVTKLAAAKIALAAGCHMVITLGKVQNPLRNLLNKEGRATWFVAAASPLSARKHWISGALHPTGTLIVDDGAAKALAGGKSLLPAGVRRLEGAFERGDAVLIKDESGRILGRGLVAYSLDDAQRIIGKRSDEIAALLGYKGRDNIIHRNDMVLE